MDEYYGSSGEFGFESEDEDFDYIAVTGESPFSEAEEMELAAELLSITTEGELDQFLGKLFKSAWRGIKKVGKTVGKFVRPLGGVLKGVAKAALPLVGGALGSFIPIPGVGTALGGALGSAVSKALEVGVEGLSEEEHEFEVARRFVRMAGIAARNAAAAPPGSSPVPTAQAAVASAARKLAASTVAGLPSPLASGFRARQGRWTRRAGNILVHGG
jgi:hypothetical protein